MQNRDEAIQLSQRIPEHLSNMNRHARRQRNMVMRRAVRRLKKGTGILVQQAEK